MSLAVAMGSPFVFVDGGRVPPLRYRDRFDAVNSWFRMVVRKGSGVDMAVLI
jgi:hypothetical protein